ncbi:MULTISPECIES: Ldh family oxidoreductase [unclassified Devosia]|jgi:LDH2 family malate/lactate/ureidoglycolate dehydrogenase|uniref:Ldh family oxidoreductase n=1 Tax=unclassified Devosia TaxID=196773 RepID=UPI0007143843|nr:MULTISPECIES: Ldh family oxidoreductase [unclassified Devosia]KQN69751.1 oxidoreductase [Devosia sp. Leaf64]KQT45868.1 oxidoreductase [Devosia sp. Leaf420]
MDNQTTPRFPEALVRSQVEARLAEAGASEASRAAAIRAMLHASLVGVDSHGVRLTEHYCRMLGGGRLNQNPQLTVDKRGAGSALIHADDGLGHYAAYKAVEVGIELAREAGVGAVGIQHSSHLGAAGAYAVAGAEQGFVTFATTNTDSMVALFDGAQKFHGTNPLAFAAPVAEGRPWLLDMATSSIPLNRVLLHRSLDKELPAGVAATPDGQPTTDPHEADMLLPLGGVDYGYKGAALAGVATLFSALLTGTTLDGDFIPMYGGDDISTPRNMGHFVLVIDPDKFAGREVFLRAIGRYLESLRGSHVRKGGRVMAPGDREWSEMDKRKKEGIPLDPDTVRFLGV